MVGLRLATCQSGRALGQILAEQPDLLLTGAMPFKDIETLVLERCRNHFQQFLVRPTSFRSHTGPAT